MRPDATRLRENAAANVGRGNVLLVGEEDYLDDGDELLCDRAGTFQTWHVPTLGGSETIAPLDIINPVKFGDGRSTPIGGFCSAHWFAYHQSGIVAQGCYQQSLRARRRTSWRSLPERLGLSRMRPADRVVPTTIVDVRAYLARQKSDGRRRMRPPLKHRVTQGGTVWALVGAARSRRSRSRP